MPWSRAASTLARAAPRGLWGGGGRGEGGADGVGEGDLVAAEGVQAVGDVAGLPGVGGAAVGAGDGDGDVAAQPDAVDLGATSDRGEAGEGLVDRGAQVGPGKGLCGGG